MKVTDFLDADEKAADAPQPAAAKANGTATPTTPHFVVVHDGESPFDLLDRAADWDDIFVYGKGYTKLDRPPDIKTLVAYKRPGGESDYSVKILKDNPHVVVVHSDACGLPTGAGQKLTKARVCAIWYHNGDEKAAATALLQGTPGYLPPHIQAAVRGPDHHRQPAPDPAGREQQKQSESEFWEARSVLAHLRDFARARLVSPWALFGCVLARVVAAVSPDIVLPPIIGGPASLNLFIGIVGTSGDGKGTAESAAAAAIDLPSIQTLGPGSGEGLAHLFVSRSTRTKELEQHTTAVILSAGEVDTLAALKGRQASTLFPEFRKAWMGEPLGFAYADPAKRLSVARHSYRLCLVVGIQPTKATPILEDEDAGTPQRFLWLPAEDPDAPDELPEQPEAHTNPLWRPSGPRKTYGQRSMGICETARAEIIAARRARLRGNAAEALDGHALLAQEKVAAALALLAGRDDKITEEDWRLAGMVRNVSNITRQRVIDALARAKADSNRARGHAEADRAIVVDNRMAEVATQRVARWIMRKLDEASSWVSHADLRRKLKYQDRDYFEDAIEALKLSGQIEERAVKSGQNGTEYRKR